MRCVSVVASVFVAVSASSAGGPAYPGKTWERRESRAVGLDGARLRKMAASAGGRGCVVRHGVLAFTWGDAARRGDVASAAKPWYAHFLFKAIEDRRLTSPDAPVVALEPGLQAPIAPSPGATWPTRRPANGLAEKPGTAFCYNDWQMALFWDLLFLKVYGVTYDTVDEHVLHPLLTDVIQCEDKPTFMAFGTRNRAGRLAVSPRDFCRFGLLYLRKGAWCGKQVISRELATMAVSSPLPNSLPRASGKATPMLPGQRSIGSRRVPDNQCEHRGSYSWLWWINGTDGSGRRRWPDVPADAYGCFGHGGAAGHGRPPGLDLIVSWNDARIKSLERENEVLRLLARSVLQPRGSRP